MVKISSLKTFEQQKKHLDKAINDLHSQCGLELQVLISADGIPDNYKVMSNIIAIWIIHRLSQYQKEDAEMIADYLLLFITKMSNKHGNSSIVLVCFMEILKPYLSLNLYEEIRDSMERILASFRAEIESN